ncbi:MAG: ParB/RepB/Spo0J family partition protein [Turneriella sp.]|nr:ParB/RepB/Spo0J family partition protein [Leptospiraceae bacterium]MCX7632273.1 ParB/RepB/Spo0J family partition protein [Turneriella sp.]
MPSKTKKLALAADILEQDIEGIVRKIALKDIVPATSQPRTQFDEESIRSLAASLASEGLMQPILVTKEAGKYKIIAGERRYRAALLNGWQEIECRILRKNSKDSYRLAVIENLQRENLNPVDEARALRKLKEEFGYTDSDLARITGKSRNYINEIVSVADLPAEWATQGLQAGIDSKNLFIQYAQAVKNGVGEAFLAAFRSGSLRTVAQAKNFNQSHKARPPQTAPIEITAKSGCHAGQCFLEFRFRADASPEKLQILEKKVMELIRKYFS